MSTWKACDIRGRYGTELDTSFAGALGRAVGHKAAGGQVLVAGDVRPSTPALKSALVAGLSATGAQVLDGGIAPTPAFYQAKRRLGVSFGVMVTASHNPPSYNGFKLELGDWPMTEEDLADLRQTLEAGVPPSAKPGTTRPVEIMPAYERELIASFGRLTPRRLVVDAGNGCLSESAPHVLKALGLDIVPLYCVPDGTFPNRSPNPAVPENLGALRETVRYRQAELGLAYDGDGDRVICVDGQGRVLSADRVFVLLLQRGLREQPGTPVVYDLKSSDVVREQILASGGVPLCERSGFAYIKRRLLAEKAVLAGEISGHYFFGALGRDDALYASCYLLAELDHRRQTVAEALTALPNYPITPDIRLPCEPARAASIIQQLTLAFDHLPQDHLDGIRVDFGDGWALARKSVTEPLLTLRFEAHTPERLQDIQRQLRRASSRLAAIWPE